MTFPSPKKSEEEEGSFFFKVIEVHRKTIWKFVLLSFAFGGVGGHLRWGSLEHDKMMLIEEEILTPLLFIHFTFKNNDMYSKEDMMICF